MDSVTLVAVLIAYVCAAVFLSHCRIWRGECLNVLMNLLLTQREENRYPTSSTLTTNVIAVIRMSLGDSSQP